MEKTDWKVAGMTCSNCALSVSKFLEKKGMEDVNVNPITGAVSFTNKEQHDTDQIKEGIRTLGYSVIEDGHDHGHHHDHSAGTSFLSSNKKRFLFCLPFTLILMLHMLHGWLQLHWLMNPWLQLVLCMPVFITGMWFFGRSAVKSLRNGVPNMDVLIAIGALASFVYSLTGAVLALGEQYLFFETTASIITLVFMGNYLEEASVQSTQKAIRSLARSQKVMANMIAYDDQHQENIFTVDNSQLKTGDLILIKNGEQVPADCKILWGECLVNEAIITGESLPVTKQKKDLLIGGSVLEDGSVKAQVTAAGKDTVLSGILKMVENAQSEKPPLQKMADKISAVFVPVVIGIAVLTFVLNYTAFGQALGTSLMRSIAVLVISCPCAMGIATPAAIAVGLGRAARSGILFRNAASLESFKTIRKVVFDKTGTLTTGDFVITSFHTTEPEEIFQQLVFSLEKFSNHPLAKAITKGWKSNQPVFWKKITEIKGTGMEAEDTNGNKYKAGSYKILPANVTEPGHSMYVLKNDQLIGWIDLQDEIRPEAKAVIEWLHKQHIETILLSGDSRQKCMDVAAKLNIDEVIAEQTPRQKLEKIAQLNAEAPTAMIGDGINDAPALAKATLGISLSDASQIAMQSADVILTNKGLKNLPKALGLGRHTYITIKQNLFWAFLYNIVALPVAAVGWLTPTVAALAMGLSDVVLAANSARLFIKKVL
jgi:P-type Cu+ transporter